MTDFKPFSKTEKSFHVLNNGFSIQSAPERLFGVSYAIYRDVNTDFDEFLEYGADLEGLNYCFWVLRGEQKVGGIILRPNHIEGLFVIPPYDLGYEIIQAVLPLLASWSNPDQDIEAVDVMPGEIEMYERLGFRRADGRRVYIAPTQPYSISWDDWLEVVTPTPSHTAGIAALFLEGYRDYPREHQLSSYSMEDWVKRVGQRLEQPNVPQACHNASTLLIDRSAGRFVGACIVRSSRSGVRPDVSYAKVGDISVHPEYRRQGLGRRMLLRALSELSGHFPVLKFGVAIGNAAESLYYDTGFLPGVAHYRLLLPAQCREDMLNDRS